MSDVQLPIKRHGGKGAFSGKLAQWIGSKVRTKVCDTYCEPYAGGASVLLYMPGGHKFKREVLNDIEPGLAAFWRVMSSPVLFPEFYRLVETLPFSEEVYNDAVIDTAYNEPPDTRTIATAVRFFVMSRMSRQGLGKDFATHSKRTRGGYTEQVSAWISAVDGLPDIHKRLRGIEVHCKPALDVIEMVDDMECCLYCDPPYMHETRGAGARDCYENEMSDAQHEALLRKLCSCVSDVILSGYPSQMYADYLETGRGGNGSGWRKLEFDIVNNASSAQVKEVKTECLWLNY